MTAAPTTVARNTAATLPALTPNASFECLEAALEKPVLADEEEADDAAEPVEEPEAVVWVEEGTTVTPKAEVVVVVFTEVLDTDVG